MPDPTLTYFAASVASGGAVGAITVGLRSLIGRSDKLSRIDRQAGESAISLSDLEKHLRSLEQSIYTRELAERDHKTLYQQLDEVKRRVAALEDRVHGFSLNGGSRNKPQAGQSE